MTRMVPISVAGTARLRPPVSGSSIGWIITEFVWPLVGFALLSEVGVGGGVGVKGSGALVGVSVGATIRVGVGGAGGLVGVAWFIPLRPGIR